MLIVIFGYMQFIISRILLDNLTYQEEVKTKHMYTVAGKGNIYITDECSIKRNIYGKDECIVKKGTANKEDEESFRV